MADHERTIERRSGRPSRPRPARSHVTTTEPPTPTVRFERFFELASGLMCVMGLDGRFLELSRSWSDLLGWSQEELLGRSYLDLVHPDDVARTVRIADELAARGSVDGFENRYRHRDGSYRWLRWSSVFHPEDGQLYAVVRDVTEERRRQALSDELELVTGVGTWELDLETRLMHASPVAHALHGTDPSAPVRAVDGLGFYLPEHRSQVEAAYLALVTDGIPFDHELPLISRDGRQRWVRSTGRAKRRDGRVVRAFGTIQDITAAYEERARLRHFRDLVELSEEGIVEVGADGVIGVANQRIAAMLEAPVDAIVGRHARSLIDADDVPSAYRFYRKLRERDGQVIRGELRLRRPSGDGLWVQVTVRSSHDDAGELDRLVIVATDISARKQREAALHAAERAARDSEERLTRVLTATQDGWWDVDLVTGTQSVSDRWRQIHGIAPDAPLGDLSDSSELVHPDDVASVAAQMEPLLAARRRTFTIATRTVRPDGTVIPIVTRVLVDYDDTGRPVRFSGATTDVTAEQRADAAKEEFVSTVSHELRTPLTSIGGALEMLRAEITGPLTDRAGELVDVARRNTVRLRGLIDDLLDMEQLATGVAPMDRVVQPLQPIVERTLHDHGPYAAAHEVSFVLTDRIDGLVSVDGARIEQVLANLLSNAAKYAPAGTSVEVRSQLIGDRIRTEVVDRGPGVPADFTDRLFERFAQADPADPRSRGGTGLGLAISRRIVDRHDGQVGYASQPGRTCFWFDLPVIAAADDVSTATDHTSTATDHVSTAADHTSTAVGHTTETVSRSTTGSP